MKVIAPDVSAGDICEKGVGEGYTYNPDDYEVTDYYNADNVTAVPIRKRFPDTWLDMQL